MNIKPNNFQRDYLYKIVETFPIASGITDLKGKFLKINDLFIKIFGYKLEKISTISKLLQKVCPDTAVYKEIKKAWEKKVKNPNTNHDKPKIYLLKNKDKSHLYVELNIKSINDMIFIFLNDITEQKQNKEKLQNTIKKITKKYPRLEANIPGMVYTFKLNADGSYSFPYVSQESYILFNIHPEDLMNNGSLLSELIHPDDRIRIEKSIVKSLKTLRPWREEFRHIVNGKVRWYDCRSLPEKQPNGDIIWTGIILEITERKKSEEVLKNSENFLNNIIDQSPYAIWISDEKGTLIKINKTSCKMLNITPDEVIGKYNIFKDNIVKEQGYIPLIKKVFEKGKTIKFEIVYDSSKLKNLNLNKNTFLILDVTIFPIKNTKGKITNAVIQHVDITEQKITKESLKESEERYKELANSISDIFFAMDKNLKYTYWNKASEILTGIPAEKAIGKSIYDLFPETQGSKLVKLYHKAINNKQPLSFINSYNIKGKYYIFEINVYPTHDGISVFTKDITEKKKAEDLLYESEKRYKQLFDHINSGVAVYEVIGDCKDFIFKDFNRAGEKIDHQSKKNLIGKSIYDVRPGIEKFGLIDVFKKVWKTGNPEYLPITFYQDNRINGWYENFVYKLSSGEIVAVFENITDRKKAEEELKLSESHYRELFENSPISLWEEDFSEIKKFIDELKNNGTKNFRKYFDENPEQIKKCINKIKIININKTTLDIYKAKNKNEFFNGLNNVFCDESNNIFKEELIAIAEGNLNFESEAITKTLKDDKNHILLKLYIIPEEKDTWNKVIVSILDITKSKKAEEEIKRLNRDLAQRVFERTAQLEAVNKELESFTYSVSHDLRAPIRHIHGFINIFKEEIGTTLKKENLRQLEIVSNSAKQMGELIDSLLAFSHMSKNDLYYKEVDMNKIINNVIQDMKLEIQNKKIIWKIAALPKVKGDKILLKEVWTNLISNAIKYSSKRKNPKIEIGIKTDIANQIIFFISDNGIGFDMRYINKLFGVFQRLHSIKEYEGLGIGLATVKRIISRHEGNIWAEGKVNKGATFYFTLSNFTDDEKTV